jgi:uncharacterized membrane protein
MKESFSSRVADKVANIAGSWRFILVQSTFILTWIIWNSSPGLAHFDLYPFVLLNLFIGVQTAYTGPFVLMSQSRQDKKDHELSERIYALEQQIEARDEKILATLQFIAYGKEKLHVGIPRRTLRESSEKQSSDRA